MKGKKFMIKKILSEMLTILTISSAVSITPKTFAAVTVEKEETSTLKKVKDFISEPVTAVAIGAAVTGGAIVAALKLMSNNESQNATPGTSINNAGTSINNDFSIRGIPNVGNSCYLNSALQQLYTMEYFRNKVLNFDTTGLDENNSDHRKLIAVKTIFEYLQGTRDLTKDDIENLMFHYLDYDKSQKSSYESFASIKMACSNSLKHHQPINWEHPYTQLEDIILVSPSAFSIEQGVEKSFMVVIVFPFRSFFLKNSFLSA